MAEILEQKFLSRDEAAKALDLTPQTLDRWRKSGSGPPYAQLGRQILYPRDGLQAWLANQFRAA